MRSFDLELVSLSNNLYYDQINYSYGCCNTTGNAVLFSQNGNGVTTKQQFSKNTPINWKAVNIASVEKMKAYIGASVDITFYEKDSNTIYRLFYVCLVDEYTWDIFINNKSYADYFGHGTYNTELRIYV